MAITNGYATLLQFKQRLKDMGTYTASTISFTSSSKTIADTKYGLGRFNVGDILVISGSASNDGYYTVATAGNNSIVVTESLADEGAAASVTISQQVSTANPVNPAEDAMMEEFIEEASRWIDDTTGMTFYSNSETRKFIVGKDTEGSILWLDKPLLSVTSLTNGDGETLTADTEYILLEVGRSPYHQIKLIANGGKAWQYTTDPYIGMIEVEGGWGNYATAPLPIRSACLLMAARLWKRKDAIFGVAGATSLGEIRMHFPQDKDVMNLLRNYTLAIGYNYG